MWDSNIRPQRAFPRPWQSRTNGIVQRFRACPKRFEKKELGEFNFTYYTLVGLH